MIGDPLFYACAIPALLIIGIAKGGLGGGIGILGVPLLALAVEPVRAAAIVLPILIVMDVQATWTYWRQWDRANLRTIVPGALVGIAIGSVAFRYLSADQIRVLVGALALGFALHYYLGGQSGAASRSSYTRGTLWSSIAGFTSFGVHAGGPPINVYLLPQQLGRTTFQATTVAFFAIVNAVKLIPYAWLGQLDASNLSTSLVLLPLAPVGISLGAWLHRRSSDLWFFRIVYASLVVVGARLIADGLFA